MAGLTFGILTISDTCFENPSEDKSGDELVRLINDQTSGSGLPLQGTVVTRGIVADDEIQIKDILIKWCDITRVNVILTTGGTGFSGRDVTPEATKKVIEKEAPGLSLAMLNASLKVTPMAMLSRPVCGIRWKTIIINLPGSTKAVKECLDTVAGVIPHAVDLVLDNKRKIKETHSIVQATECHHQCTHGINSTKVPFKLDNVANRLRKSPYPMISMEEAAEMINRFNWTGNTQEVDLWRCHGKILANSIGSRCDLPPFRASIKDGYAVIASDGRGRRIVLGGLVAGQLPGGVKLTSGYCVRVNTGAPIPDEATAVVQVEDTKLVEKHADDREEKVIEILLKPVEGQDIRPIGSDIKEDALVLTAGTRIGAVEMGILAASGCTEISVRAKPIVGILSTGNELQQAGEKPRPGHVYDSNKITLMMLLEEQGFSAKDLGICVDDENVMIDTIRESLKHIDVLITTGSVSMGDRDMLKPILKAVFNATIHFGRVNMKPGKPTTFATCRFNGKTKYFLCLPGNPVSATVTAHLFAIPLLKRLSGDCSKPIIIKARLKSSYKLDSRPEYARAVCEWTNDGDLPVAYGTGNQISSKLLNCQSANALLMLPGRTSQCSELHEGDIVKTMLLGFK